MTWIDRRTFLRGALGGAAVGVGLPLLEAMVDGNGRAFADGHVPTRFGIWFWGNGIRRDHWVPGATGRGWDMKEELQPLAPVRDAFSLVSGYEIKTATHPHHSGMSGIFTGARYHQVGTTRDTIVSTFAHPSVDQLAADHFEGQTPFRSLEVAVCRFRGTDEGTTFQHLSHNGPNNVNPSEYSPYRLFERLFGGGLTGPQVDRARRSVLDAVTGRIRSLQTLVSGADRVRLEQHFDSIRALEHRLASGTLVACTAPDAPAREYPDIDGKEQIEEKNRAMSELVALALACDLTRAFSVMFSTAGSGVIIWQAGARNSLHQIAHDEALPQPTVHAATVFTMGQLSYFLQRLRDTPEGDGNLLDHCSILCTTELSEGNTHSNDEFPILIAGAGGGRLVPGLHHRGQRKPNTSQAVLTALQGAGLPLSQFGYDEGLATQPISELLA